VSMISCDESQSDGDCSESDLSSFCMIGKKLIDQGRWTKQEVKFAENTFCWLITFALKLEVFAILKGNIFAVVYRRHDNCS